MSIDNSSMKIKRNILLLILIGLALGPELYLFAPEILLFFQAAGVEYLVASLTLVFIPMKDYLVFWLQKIFANERLRKYGIFIPFVFVAPFLPEVVLIMDIGLISTLMLASSRLSLLFPLWLNR